MYFKQFFDEKLAQYAYLIGCQAEGTAVIIDPMRDIDQYIDAAAKEKLTIIAAADTHIHADYISGLREFAERGVKIYASDEGDKEWKYEWLLNSEYDYELLKDGDEFETGNILIKAWHTPGHTPEHLSYLITDRAAAEEPLGIVTGDFIFVGDVGRPDLLETAAGQENVMEDSARTLFKSVEKFKEVDSHLQIWPGHGAGSACGKALGAVPVSTAGYELKYNNSIKAATAEQSFVDFILDGQPEPPFYFARMKRDNKMGPRVLPHIPEPVHLSQDEIRRVMEDEKTVVLDTRDASAFAGGHLPGSLLAPLNKSFNTIAGSYIMEDERIVLVVEESRVKEAVLDLYRIGLDHVTGYLTPADIEEYVSGGGHLKTLTVESFDEIYDYIHNDAYQILDVRKDSEYQAGNVEGAHNIAHTRMHARRGELPEDKALVVHCQAGGRASVAAAYLKRKGHDVILIEDSFNNYDPTKAAD
ncbi:MAG TPA: MBL fold metallo-hydrolase [Balneolaceae bacterium]|nr:MBL fold metallo-hydrolase [Balneolaceae bacterium]